MFRILFLFRILLLFRIRFRKRESIRAHIRDMVHK